MGIKDRVWPCGPELQGLLDRGDGEAALPVGHPGGKVWCGVQPWVEADRWYVGWISVIGVKPLLYSGEGVGLGPLSATAFAEAPQARPGAEHRNQVD